MSLENYSGPYPVSLSAGFTFMRCGLMTASLAEEQNLPSLVTMK